MMTYRDGDPRYDIIPPGERLPTGRQRGDRLPTHFDGPAQGNDFAWLRPTLIQRLRGRGAAKSLQVLNEGLNLSTEYNNNTAAYELSRQAVVHARNQVELLPLKLEQERSTLQLGIVETRCAIETALEKRQRAQIEHERFVVEEKGRRKVAKANNENAKRARRNARRAAREARYAVREPQPAGLDDGPEPFNRHFRTMQAAKENLSEGERRIREIYARAARERRQLTEQELLEVDAIADAAAAAEDEIRRGAASDFRR